MEQRWGQVTLQGSPEMLGVPGVMPGLGPGEEGGTPLPTSTASREAPPSTGVSGESSSRSVDRLYSTICQTVGGANPGQAERAVCPWPSPSAPCPARPPPACSKALPSCPVLRPGVPPIPAPQGRSPYSANQSPCQMPPAPRSHRLPTPPHPRPPPGASALEPGVPTHVAAAA